jgi:hypothetical protein
MAGPSGLIFAASSAAIFRIASSLENAVSRVPETVGDSPAVGARGSAAGPAGGVAGATFSGSGFPGVAWAPAVEVVAMIATIAR